MTAGNKVNILLVDDQAGKLLSYEVMLRQLGENLITASSGRQALECLLKNEIAVVLLDVCMPDLDGFQLAAMIREHPRFQNTAMIFISAIQFSDIDRLRGYEMGAVDYVSVPVIPEVLRAKVKVFAELYRKTRQLEELNAQLEERVQARTAELEAFAGRLLQSEQRRSLALAAGNMGSWDWDRVKSDCLWDEGQCRIFGVDPHAFVVTGENVRALVHPADWEALQSAAETLMRQGQPFQGEFRIRRPNGEVRWCYGSAAPTLDESGAVIRISGVTSDITERKDAEERQLLLAREVDHRAKNALALVQSIVRLTRATTIDAYISAVEGRLEALSRVHAILAQSRWTGADLQGILEEEFAPFRSGQSEQITLQGPQVLLEPIAAQTLALVLHELATNAAKYGALSSEQGRIRLNWAVEDARLDLEWIESGGPRLGAPTTRGFGTRLILASVEGQLGGKVALDWQAAGLHCRVSFPVGQRTTGSPASSGETPRAPPSVESNELAAASRVMVVEDEPLVGMALTDLLKQLGLAVIGPFGKLEEAAQALEAEGVDAALLDVNLAGEMVYPLADRLLAERVPFVFLTGYERESIDRRYNQVRILRKPVEPDALRAVFRPPTSVT